MMNFSGWLIPEAEDFVFGTASRPVTTRRGFTAGGGTVFPEVNFTLPAMSCDEPNWPRVLEQYDEMIRVVLERCVALSVPQVMVEFETLPEMTLRPAWGLEVAKRLAGRLREAQERHGFPTALRFTPNDIREFSRPPILRSGPHWERMLEMFEGAGDAGADFLAIESTGGKELCDTALTEADLEGVLFSLGVLGCRDMAFLWDAMVAVCGRTGVIPSGDTACGFANTAMVLAEKGMIPAVFAAVVRVASAPRRLVAVERGALGPCKDCGYEGVYVKAMTGTPISMEGKSAACAHFSPLGNIAAAVCDGWSNESVQNVSLLSGKAPAVSAEQLAFDCRLMNTAARRSREDALRLRDWLAESDAPLDPQAYVLHPDVVLRLSREIVRGATPYERVRIAAGAAIGELRRALGSGACRIPERERPWLDRLEEAFEEIPSTEEGLIAKRVPDVDPAQCDLSQYGL